MHVLVAQAFLDLDPAKSFVCHNDGNPLNNVATNLRRDSPAGNAADRSLHGTQQHTLTMDQVRYIRREYAAGGVTYRELGEELGVSTNAIGTVIRGQNWAWLK